ncbi:TMED8 [Pelobates cultripes]|uniref:TMED8, partial n=1 Tax=Pelobates cultripes TaxID=61616 RepID=A0AAD1TNN1_PELCU|nr:TMED8 [Pelobates cultripes]
MSEVEEAASLPGDPSLPEGLSETPCAPPQENGISGDESSLAEHALRTLSLQETERSPLSSEEAASEDRSSQCSSVGKTEDLKESTLEKILDTLQSLEDSEAHDVLMIHSEHSGVVDVVKVEKNANHHDDGRAPPPPLAPATTWTSANLREFKNRMASEKQGQLTIRRGEVVTVRVPTHPDGKRLCWEFATDDYDIGFGIYFDWTTVTSTAVTLQVSESSDEEDEEETESPWHNREGDVERGSVYRLRSRYGEIMQVYRRDSHREVQAGSHEYPGEGIYLLKLDNSYSLMRNKTLYLHVYYSS